MPTLYYKEDGDWKPLDLGNIKNGRFTANATSYSYNFPEPFAEGYNKPNVVATAYGSNDEVRITGTSRNGFTVTNASGNAPFDVMFFASQGEPLTYDNANGEELLDYFLSQVLTDQTGAQRVADYFDSRFSTMSWDHLGKLSQVGSAFPSLFTSYQGKTKTVNFGSNGGNKTCRVIGTNRESAGFFTFMATKSLTDHQMNSSNTTSGGWENCAMRSWLNSTVLNGMDAGVRNIIKSVNKKNTSGYGAATTSDKLWLLSQTETGLTSGSAEGAKYPSLPNLSSPANTWWLRSVGDSVGFYRVYGGSLSYSGASDSIGVVPGFVI